MRNPNSYPISTVQVESTGNIAAIAIVQRLDRIVELLEALVAEALELEADPTIRSGENTDD